MRVKISAAQKPLTDTAIRHHVDQVRAAQAKRERDLAALQRSDRRGPLYSPLEQQEREQRINAELEGVVRPKLELGFEESRDAQNLVATIEEILADPLAQLDEAGLARANALRPFVEEDLRLPAERLEAKVKAILAAGDLPHQVVLYRALVARITELDVAVPPNVTGADVPEQHRAERAKYAPLVDLLVPTLEDAELKAQLTEQVQRVDQARKLIAAVNAETRAGRVAELQEQLVATGEYAPL